MKKIQVLSVAIAMLAGSAFFSSCGGNSNNTDSSNTEANSSATTDEADANDDAVLDPDAKSDSKGVGRFTSVDVGATIDEAMATKGQAIFDTKCTACHKTTDEKLVGPGLKNITNLRTPEWIMNMITNPEEMTKKDPVAKALFEKHLVQMTFQNVSDDEARQILEFLRKNDKG
ncbi:cytochrome C [Pelobium manganitolerans]|uniref:Cytochrome C n=1 Tax=Pelobium manganitolerans TaxID=1842495 RepID=A0A419S248_9SPHI|nr:cytochrome c [Pelobium manganitolerans]RKD12809.1 cytochrome C [Pelobium manganitolerans]